MKPRSFGGAFLIYMAFMLVVLLALLGMGLCSFILFGGTLSELPTTMSKFGLLDRGLIAFCAAPWLLTILLSGIYGAVFFREASHTFKYEDREAFLSAMEGELKRVRYHLKEDGSPQELVFHGPSWLVPRLVARLGPDSADVVGPYRLVRRLSKLDISAYTRGEALPSEERPVRQEQEAPPAEFPELTQEEKEVLALVIRALSDDEIAKKLRVTARHVFQVKAELFHKFGVHRDDDLVWEARKRGYNK